MMYEQRVDIIVNVGSDNSLPHWNEVSYGNVSKKLNERIKLDQNVTREKIDIFVKTKKSKTYHPTTVYHFTAWPKADKFEDWKRFRRGSNKTYFEV